MLQRDADRGSADRQGLLEILELVVRLPAGPYKTTRKYVAGQGPGLHHRHGAIDESALHFSCGMQCGLDLVWIEIEIVRSSDSDHQYGDYYTNYDGDCQNRQVRLATDHGILHGFWVACCLSGAYNENIRLRQGQCGQLKFAERY